MQISSLRSAGMGLLRSLAIATGSLLVVALSAQVSAAVRRAMNEAAGYTPNMEPGVVVSLAVIAVAPIVVAVLFVELTRSWGFRQKPLSIPSCTALGALAALPVAYKFSPDSVHFGYPVLLLASALGVAVFYIVRGRGYRGRRRVLEQLGHDT
jgi:hypothetical protein